MTETRISAEDQERLAAYIGDLVTEVRTIAAENYEGQQIDWNEVWDEHLVIVAVPALPSLPPSTVRQRIRVIQDTVRAIIERN